jgi:thiol-disulfide isomerase/thioredoxin
MLLTKQKMAAAFLVAIMAGARMSSPAYYAGAPHETVAKNADTPKSESKNTCQQLTEGHKPRIDSLAADQLPAPAGAADERNIRGSGKVVIKEITVADFTTVEVSRSFRVEITRADSFRVAITADENLFPYIKAVKDGSGLRLSLEVKSFSASALKATIAMPALERVNVARGGKVTCKAFKSAKIFQAILTGSSTLEGEIEADKVGLDASGGSQVTLKGSAKEAKISASQECLLFLTDFVVEQADITLKNGSKAAVNVKERLDYELDSACRLEYLVMPARTTGTTSAGSSALTSLTPGKGWARPKEASSHHHHGAAQTQGASSQGNDSVAHLQVPVGKKVPDFSLRDLDGKTLKFSELQKEAKQTNKGAVVLSIWCSTCSSCRRIEHDLDKLAKDYRGKALVVALDANAGEMPEEVRDFAKNKGLTLPIFLNPDGRAADIFGTEVTTTTVVIDGDGVLRYCGRFSKGAGHAYAEDALKAVLAGKEVGVKMTPQDG